MTDQTWYPFMATIRFVKPLVLGCLFVAAYAGNHTAIQQACGDDQPPMADKTVRELFVPFDQLPLILGGKNERVFMTRPEYRDLQRRASQQPPPKAPVPTVLIDAEYEATVHENDVVFQGQIGIDVLAPGLQSVVLPMSGVRVGQANLDENPAPLARNDQGQVVLFVQGLGRHRLTLELHAPVVVAAAQQSIAFQVPHAGSVAIRFTVQGNVEVKSGADVVRRTYDNQADHTTFDLACQRGPTSLVMSLNNRRLLQEQVIVARSVMVSELTTTNELLHANISLQVLHGACDTFSFDLPDGFQVTHVTSPLLARWAIRTEQDQQILDVRLREATRATEVVNIAAAGPPSPLGHWSLPKLSPRHTAGSVRVIGLLAESRLRPLRITSEGLLPIHVSVLRNALPESFFVADSGRPQVRPIAAFYAPTESYSLTAQLEDPPDELHVTTHLLLSLSDEQQTVRGGFTLIPTSIKRKTLSFQLPAIWQLERVYLQEDSPLECDQYRIGEQRRCVVTLPQAIEPGQNTTVYFEASYRSSAWLEPWDSVEVPFPDIRVEQAAKSTGAIAIQANGDLRARPSSITGLVPLDSDQRARFGLDDSSTELTFRFSDPQYSATFTVQRVQPVISSRNYSFFQIRHGSLAAHYEVIFDIDRAHVRRLQIDLPASTPSSLTIRGLDGVELKEYSLEATEETHHWQVLLAEAQMGQVRLTLDFQQPLTGAADQNLPLPIIQTGNSAYQTQMVSVEGDPSLDISITTQMRAVDVGELVEAEYTPGQRLLGTFASTDGAPSISVNIELRDLAPLPAAVVEHAELITQLSPSGIAQTAATYRLRTKVPFLAVQLPESAQLWSTSVNGTPRKPRRRENQILLSVQTEDPTQPVTLQIAYQTIGQPMGWQASVAARAPKLSLVARQNAQGTPVPLVDLVWRVYVPAGYGVAHSWGTVAPTTDLQQPWPVRTLAQAAIGLGGGFPMAAYETRRMVAGKARQMATREARQLALAERSAGEAADAVRLLPAEEPAESNQPAATPRRAGKPRGNVDAGSDPFGPQSTEGEVKQPQAGQPYEDGSTGPQSPPLPGLAGQMGLGNYDSSQAIPGPQDQPATSSGADPFNGPGGTDTAGSDKSMHGGMGGMGGGSSGSMGMMSGGGMGSGMGGGHRFPGGESEELKRAQQQPAQQETGRSRLATAKLADKYWALQGLRGLTIEIDPNGTEYEFRSLGSDPTLQLALYQKQRVDWLAWAVALVIALGGLLLIRAPILKRFLYVATVLLIAAGLPLLDGSLEQLTIVCERAMFAAVLLIPAWIAAAFVALCFRFAGNLTRRVSSRTVTGLLLVVVVCLPTAASQAQEEDLHQLLAPLLERTEPVKIPDDAVVIPYDPQDMDGRQKAEQVLVPYERYVELWQQAHGQPKLDSATGQRFSLAGARYEGELADQDHLLLKGQLDIELFTDQPVEVPLALHGAMVTQAKLDGQLAPLKALEPAPTAVQGKAKSSAKMATPLLGLVIRGPGRHHLDLTVRVAIVRQGGWRRVHAVLPHAEATALVITVPQAESQIRRSLGNTSFLQTTERDHQTIESVLKADGRLELAWRPKISPGTIDQSLTADSTAIVDLREDGIHVAWHTAFQFGQTERAAFQVSIPAGYLVESVQGENVRGWDLKQQGEQHELTIELLKAVKGQEQAIIHLANRMPLAFTAAQTIPIPYIRTRDAALNQGTLLVRRSPILEVTTTNSTGVARTDSSAVSDQMRATLGDSASPLGIRDYQAFRFNTLPFDISVNVDRYEMVAVAELRTLARLGETESSLESQILLDIQRRAVYRLQINIPSQLQLERVSCRELSDWSTTQQEGHKTLHLFLASGQENNLTISLEGRLNDHTPTETLAIPQLTVQDVAEQHGTIVFQIDPSLNAELSNLEQCEPILMERATAWLTAKQRPLARLAVEYQQPDYAGQVVLTPGRSLISCNSFTNVRITFREIQDTILLDYHVTGAGSRKFQFLLPNSLADARIDAPLIRQKRLENVDGQSLIQVTLELQEAVTGQYRVVIQKDRALETQPQLAPLPQIVTGSTSNRYLTLENSGRDEVVIQSVKNMEPVNRNTRQWQLLSARLQGGDFTTAYVAKSSQGETEFLYQTQRRELVKTVGATIGLSRTVLVLDQSGAFRAAVLLKVDNRTEPFLEIEMPEAAELWSAHVANQPVKPAHAKSATESKHLRVPLVKTAEGDLDYSVVLKYGGRLNKMSQLTAVQFPFVRTVNISVQRSQVKLLLPKALSWHQFSSNATREGGEEDFLAGYMAYRTRQLEGLTQILSGKNDFSKARASGNVDVLLGEMENLRREVGQKAKSEKLSEVLTLNSQAVESANVEIKQLQDDESATIDNRKRLNRLFLGQQNSLSRNRVTQLGQNFSYSFQQPSSGDGRGGPESDRDFDGAWFFDNGLARQDAQPQSMSARRSKPQQEAASPNVAGQMPRQQRYSESSVQQQIQTQPQVESSDSAALNVFEQGAVQQQDREGPSQPSASSKKGNQRGLETQEELAEAYRRKEVEQQHAIDSLGTALDAKGVADRRHLGRTRAPSSASHFIDESLALDGDVSHVEDDRQIAGWSSLDFDLPDRGTAYYFSRPGGDMLITARPVDRQLLSRVLRFAGLLASVAFLLGLLVLCRRISASRRRLSIAAVALCLVGVAFTVLMVVPLFGLVLIMGGVLVASQARQQRNASA